MEFDVIVVGGGHAGIEAAAASARLGAKTALITFSMDNLGELSCNPSIGGVSKGIIVREIDALDGVMPRVIDQSGIHFKILNSSKGPAVWGHRAQADRVLYKKVMQQVLLNYNNLELVEGEVSSLIIENNQVRGVQVNGLSYRSASVVLTTGTFLNGLIHLGRKTTPAGRFGEKPSNALGDFIRQFDLRISRLKTGTPARLRRSTINYDIIEAQAGDVPPAPFSDLTKKITVPQIDCYVTYTNADTHNYIKNNISESPMYSGQIKCSGPRYCPSIEDKVIRFADKEKHQVFLEPEGLDSDVVYPNGISTSFPEHIQERIIRGIRGLEDVEIIRYGYAIEYDYVDPRELTETLETKKIPGLFLAGQINGTTGYEEAAGQGIIAGINAALKLKNKSYAHKRSDSYIGVMISDLVANGTSEPYRMMTSRAEFRILLRPDNVIERLGDGAQKIGLLSEERVNYNLKYLEEKQRLCDILSQQFYTPDELKVKGFILSNDGKRRSVLDLLKYPDLSEKCVRELIPELNKVDEKILFNIKVGQLYEPLEKRMKEEVVLLGLAEEMPIPVDLDYSKVAGLSNELISKLALAKPINMSQAKNIQGITPVALTAISIYIKKLNKG